MRAPRSLSQQTAVRIALISIAPLVITGLLTFFFLIPLIKNSLSNQHHIVAKAVAEQVSAYLTSGERHLISISDVLHENNSFSDRQIMDILDSVCGEGEIFESLFIADKKSDVILYVGLPEFKRDLRAELIGRNVSERRFEKDNPLGSVEWSQTFLSTLTNRMAVAAVVTLPESILVGEITFDSLSDFVHLIPTGNDLRTMLLDSNSRVIADSNFTNEGRQLNFDEFLHHKGHGDYEIGSIELDGEKRLGEIKRIDEIGWRILVSQPYHVVFGQLQTIVGMVGAGFVFVFCIALFLSVKHAQYLSRWIRFYTKQAGSIANGDYALDWPETNTIEYNEMAKSLRAMTHTIQQRERQLVAREGQMKIILNSIGDGVIATDNQGNITHMNPMVEELTGWDSSIALGQPLQEVFTIINGLTRKESPNLVEKVLADGKVADLASHTLLLSNDMSELHITGSGSPIFDSNAQIVGVVIAFRDVTTSYMQEQQIRDNERNLKHVVANVPGALYEFIVDPEQPGQYHVTSVAPEKVYDVTGLELSPDNFFTDFLACVPAEDHSRFIQSIEQAIESRQTWHYEGRLNRPDGNTIWFEGHAIPKERDGKVVFVGIINDITGRKSTEDSLRLNKFYFDKASLSIFQMNKNGEVLDVNEHACEMLGYSKEELCKMTVYDINAVFNQEHWLAFRDNLEKDGFVTAESYHKTKDGSLIPVQFIANYMEYEDQQLYVAFVQDVSEKKQAEEILKQEKERTDYILQGTNAGTWEWDIPSGKLDIDDRWAEIMGKTIEQLEPVTGQTWLDSVHPADLPRVQQEIEKLFSKETGYFDLVYRQFHVDGGLVWVNGRGKVVKWADDETPVRMSGIHLDITDRKLVELEVSNLRNYLNNIIDSMPSLIIGVDEKSIVTQWNKTAENKTAISEEAAKGQFLADILPQMSDQIDDVTRSIQSGQVVHNSKIELESKNGKSFQDVTIYPLTGGDDIKGAVIRIDDVTEKVRLEEMMVQSEKMLSVGGLAAGMAHEINNPLAGMIQTANVMESRLSDMQVPANIKVAESLGVSLDDIQAYMEKRGIPRMIRTINVSGKRVAQIVDNMLSFSRKSEATFSSHHPEQLVEQTLELAATDYDLKKDYDFKTIKVVKEYQDDLPLVPCESGKIQQVFLNILRNGAQAMQLHGDKETQPCFIIRLAVEEQEQMLKIEIEDNGPGMDLETRRRVFEPFFTTKPVDVGTGLGLSVSYFIITRNHGGTMSVKSSPGEGAVFIIRLPLGGMDKKRMVFLNG